MRWPARPSFGERIEQRERGLAILGPRALDQRDRLRERDPVAGADLRDAGRERPRRRRRSRDRLRRTEHVEHRAAPPSVSTVPGANTAATPSASSFGRSGGGITPPTTIAMSLRPAAASSACSCGTSVRCPAASELTPTTCTSFSTAWRAVSAGRREQRPDVDVEAHVGEAGRDHLRAAIVPVLAHLRDQQPRTPAVRALRTPRRGASRSPARRVGSCNSCEYTPATVRVCGS